MHAFSRFRIFVFCFLVTAVGLPAAERYHTVEKGDTLYSLSKRYRLSVEALQALNHLSGSSIRVGDRLKVEPPAAAADPAEGRQPKKNGWVRYQIESGDTLYGLARRYEVPLSKLMAENHLQANDGIKKGQLLWVPSPTLSQLAPPPASGPASPPAKVTLPPQPLFPSPRPREPLSAPGLLWPAKGTLHRRKGKVEGVIIESEWNAPVCSISSGTVVWAHSFRGYQKMVVVQTPSGYNYTYCGNHQLYVKVGDRVQVGTPIGTVGYALFDDTHPNILLITYKGEKWVDPVTAPRL